MQFSRSSQNRWIVLFLEDRIGLSREELAEYVQAQINEEKLTVEKIAVDGKVINLDKPSIIGRSQ